VLLYSMQVTSEPMSQNTQDGFFWMNMQPHGVECHSLCGFEVTWKIKQFEVKKVTWLLHAAFSLLGLYSALYF